MVLHEQAVPDFVREHDIDHVTLDIIENALKNIRYEMDRVLVTAAVSPIIREQADEFPLIADRKGRMVVGQFGSPVDTVLENSPYKAEDLKDGDVIALNDPLHRIVTIKAPDGSTTTCKNGGPGTHSRGRRDVACNVSTNESGRLTDPPKPGSLGAIVR
jgi:Hydantoinase B/oxoprolinase